MTNYNELISATEQMIQREDKTVYAENAKQILKALPPLFHPGKCSIKMLIPFQEVLIYLGYTKPFAEMSMRERVLAATKAFQSSNHLCPDGIVGKHTYAALIGAVDYKCNKEKKQLGRKEERSMKSQVDNLLIKFQSFPSILNPRTADKEDFEALQDILNYLEYDSGLDLRGLTPKWHQVEIIEKALQCFQKKNNCLPATGSANQDTQRALMNAIREKRNNSNEPVGSEQEVIEFMIAWISVNHAEAFESGIKNLKENLFKYAEELGIKEVLQDVAKELLSDGESIYPNLKFRDTANKFLSI